MHAQVTFPTPQTAVLTITGGGPLNILGTPVIRALTAQLAELAERPDLHCLLLRGSGTRAFVAGPTSARWRRSTPPRHAPSSAGCATCATRCGISPCP